MNTQQQVEALAADKIHQILNKVRRLNKESDRLLEARHALEKGKTHIVRSYLSDVQEELDLLLTDLEVKQERTGYARTIEEDL